MFRTLTAAPETIAPCASVTEPEIVALFVWAKAKTAKNPIHRTVPNSVRNNLAIFLESVITVIDLFRAEHLCSVRSLNLISLFLLLFLELNRLSLFIRVDFL